MSFVGIVSFVCPRCGAQPGKACMNERGEFEHPFHAERVKLTDAEKRVSDDDIEDILCKVR